MKRRDLPPLGTRCVVELPVREGSRRVAALLLAYVDNLARVLVDGEERTRWIAVERLMSEEVKRDFFAPRRTRRSAPSKTAPSKLGGGVWRYKLRELARVLGGSFTKRDLVRVYGLKAQHANAMLGHLRRRGEIACIALEDASRVAPTKRYVIVLGPRDLRPSAPAASL